MTLLLKIKQVVLLLLVVGLMTVGLKVIPACSDDVPSNEAIFKVLEGRSRFATGIVGKFKNSDGSYLVFIRASEKGKTFILDVPAKILKLDTGKWILIRPPKYPQIIE